MNQTKHIILTAVAALTMTVAGASSAMGQVSVKVELDSAYLTMGRTTPLHVEVVGNLSETGGLLLPDTLWRDVEVAAISEPLVTDLGNGRKELRQEITLQAFDSGLYTLPPVLYLQDGKVTESNRPALKVIPVDVDSMATVHDYYGAQKPPRKFFDFLPDWMTDYGVWILLALIVIGAGLYIYFKWIKQGRIPLMPAKKPVPPYELAMQRLATLRSENLCEKGEEKEYYTRLTDILRNYLDTRFGINAMEMTSTQILQALNKNEETRMPRKYMSRILETADFVKFAKVRPLPDDNAAAFRSALQFVEDTKPQETPEDADKDKDVSTASAETKQKSKD
ncbi:MAG: cell wall anchor protein [Bacteroides sp.]|nr:cell wall anchor protein [Bacteroides sp.]